MKKNKMFRFAAVVLVITVLSTCAISGTLAKYVSEDNSYDVARVAKWGVEIQTVGALYGENYSKAATNTATNSKDDATISVESEQLAAVADGGKDVVAPGTENGTGFKFSLNGMPEVDNEVVVKINSANIKLLGGSYGVMVDCTDAIDASSFAALAGSGELYYESAADKFILVPNTVTEAEFASYKSYKFYTLEDTVTIADYYPVVYNLTGTTALDANDNTAWTSDTLKEAADAVAKAANKGTAVTATAQGTSGTTAVSYNVTVTNETNTDLATALMLSNEKLTWAWDFDRVGTAKGDDADDTDKADTILGDLIALCVKEAGGQGINGKVVWLNGTEYDAVSVGSDKITVPNVNGTNEKSFVNYYAYVGNTVVANLSTYFCIDIAATQID